MEERIAGIEGTIEQMDKRLNHIESEISELRKEADNRSLELRREINERFARIENEMRSDFRWTIGVMMKMWVTIIAAIMLKTDQQKSQEI